MPGVDDVQVEASETFMAQVQTIDSQVVTVWVPQYERAIVVRYNHLNATAFELTNLLVAAGLEPGAPENIGRAGKPIVIPPDVAT
jgi:hypothetical protein